MPRRLCLALVSLALLSACTPGVSETPTPAVVPTETAVPTEAAAQPTESAAQPTEAASGPTETPLVGDDLAVLAETQTAPNDPRVVREATTGQSIPEVARTTPLDVKVGDVETFWVADNLNNTHYQIEARLRYAGPVLLMYVDTNDDADTEQSDIEAAAKRFEEEIYPRNRSIFGEEASPGVDGDPRLTVLNTAVRGAGGYFSSADGVTKEVNRYSNERDMFVIGTDSYPISEESYLSTLAHEFQHMIEWNVARTSPSWFNEGMSTIAEDLYGFDEPYQILQHIGSPDIQLTAWGSDAAMTGSHYGTSRLFLRYFTEQYGGEDTIRELVQRDAGNHTDVFVEIAQRTRPEITSFAQIVGDWVIANGLDDANVDEGRYAYQNLPATVAPENAQPSERATVAQFGADYLELPEGPTAVRFDGEDQVLLVGERPVGGNYAWWSNRADDSMQTLTRAFDLGSVSSATLTFDAWYEIELNYDYAFVAVSADNGTTWKTLEGTNTTNDDPNGNNLGNGITGVSGAPGAEIDDGTHGEWVKESFDLSEYAGQQVLVRFWFLSDAALNGPGMLVDNISIPELGYSDDAEQSDGGWEAVGFARVTGVLPQEWVVQLIREASDGTTTVEQLPVDAQGRAGVVLNQGERGTLVIMGSTGYTTEPATYEYTMSQR